MNSPNLQTRARNIRFSSNVSERFTILGVLSEKLVEAAQEYWKSKGMTIKSIMRSDPGSNDARAVEFVAEGGTIWTTDFDSYKKRVNVNLTENEHETDILVQLVLPGGLMSMDDRDKAANLIEAFYEAIKTLEP